MVTRKGAAPDIVLLRRMLDRLYHRGPDGRGWFRDKKAALGHTRLSIIDLEGGTQPMSNEDGSVWISFNGEIFNYIELRAELIKYGHIFKTNSDTEVIVHAWESWREACFSRFNGQWAIAIWDRNRKELVLCRDRHGIRPLYYTETGDKFLFASEIKSLFADAHLKRDFDLKGIWETNTFWGPLAPGTVFKNIRELEPGHYGILKDNRLTEKPYWELSFSERDEYVPSEKEITDLARELKNQLVASTRLRFERSDVQVGSYLSGGIDSSVCASIVSKLTRREIKTYSIRFSEAQFDEGSYQSIMAERLNTHHKSFMVSPEDIGAVFPQVVTHAEQPLLRTAPAPLFLLSGLVRESGCKVVVTGEGSDEVLGGYDIFREAHVRQEIARKGETGETEALLEKLYPWMGDAFKKTPAFTRSFFSKNLDPDDPAVSHRTRWDNSKLMLPLFRQETAMEAGAMDITSGLLKGLPEAHKHWSSLARAQWMEYKTLLSGYILSAQGDRMLMGNSIEGRFPFLDVNLVSFANNLPSETKLRTRDLTEKFLLKEAFKNDIPHEILNRPKQPYQSPNGKCFFGEQGQGSDKLDWINEVTGRDIIEKAGIFDPAAVEKLMDKGRKNYLRGLTHGDNTRIISVLSTMLIYRDFIRDNDFLTKAPREWSENEFTRDLS